MIDLAFQKTVMQWKVVFEGIYTYGYNYASGAGLSLHRCKAGHKYNGSPSYTA